MIDVVESWAEEHVILLTATFESFARIGEWPHLDALQHQFEVDGQYLDVGHLGWEMPRPLGFIERGRLILLCRALLHVPAANALLEDWFRVVNYSYESWLDDPKGELISHEVVDLMEGDEHRARLVSQLLLRESWMFGSGTGAPEDYWTREITVGVRSAREASNARELVEARLAAEQGPVPSAGPPPETIELSEASADIPPDPVRTEQNASRRNFWHRLWRFVNDNQVVAGLLVIAIVALATVCVAFGKSIVHSITGSSSSTPYGKVEQAANGGARTFRVPGVMTEEGQPLKAGEKVRVACRVHVPQPPSAVPDGNWYKLASSPWNDRYFAPANSFWNGDVPGEPPYTHDTDLAVPECSDE